MSDHIFRYLDTNGDGSGTDEVVSDHAVTPDDYFIECPPGSSQDYVIIRMMVYIQDTGSFDSGGYGNGSALSNGLKLLLINGNESPEYTEEDLTPKPITTNGEWAGQCHDVDHQAYGQGDEYISARWTFAKSGRAILLKPGYKLVLRANDNFTGLVKHRFHVQGFKRIRNRGF